MAKPKKPELQSITPGGPAASSGATLARASYDLDAIVKQITEEMCRGEWRVGESHRRYAEQYGVELATTKHWAAKASLVLRSLRGDLEEVRESILTGIDHCHKLALETDDNGRRDVKAALSALELRAKVFGAMAPTKIQDVTPPREELWTSVRGWLEAPSEELARVLAETGWVRK